MHIDQALARYVTQLEADGRSPNTIAQHQRYVRVLSRWAQHAGLSGTVDEFGHERLAAFLGSPQARLRSDGGTKLPGSVNALRASISGFFSYLAKSGAIATNPARLLRRARTGRPAPRSLTSEQTERLLAVLAADTSEHGRRDLALFSLMLRAGLRLGAALQLTVRDVDWEQRSLLVRRSKAGGGERVLISPRVAEDLRAFIGDRTHGSLFLARERPISPRHVQRRFQAWLERAGIRGVRGTHVLRHTHGQRIYDATGDLLLVRTALGHRSVSSTLVYAHCPESRLRNAIAAM